MARYIEADFIPYEMKTNCRALVSNDPDRYMIAYKKRIDEMPTADVEEVRHGEWYMIEHLGLNVLKCSICQAFINVNRWGKYYRKKFKYCPICGAKMDGGKE